MPALRNARHETFATLLASGHGVKQSYLEAGYKEAAGTPGAATKLKQKPEIEARVAELIEDRLHFKNTYINTNDLDAVQQMRETGTMSREWIIAHLMTNVVEAQKAGQIGASNSALHLLGVELGMFNKKAQHPQDKPRLIEADAVSPDGMLLMLERMGIQQP